jgi:hypothetical protein
MGAKSELSWNVWNAKTAMVTARKEHDRSTVR